VPTAEQRRSFGAALARARQECGLSQRALADSVGVSQASVSQWLTGQTAPKPDRVAALERVLQLPPDTFARTLGYLAQSERGDVVPMSVTEAAEADPRLGERERRILAAVYQELVKPGE
jgi:transcriptional regulator with XRE-family HTH domain